MHLIKGFFIICLLIGIVLLIVYFMTKSQLAEKDNQKVVYKYIPRTLEETEEDPIFVSQIFKAMFTQPSIWVDSIYLDDLRQKENINKFFISQY